MKQHKDLAIEAAVCRNCGQAPRYRGHQCVGLPNPENPCPRCGVKVFARGHRLACPLCPFCPRCCDDLGSFDPDALSSKVVEANGRCIPLKNIHAVDLYLRVNGAHFEFVWLRSLVSDPSESELLVFDPQLGPFPLDDAFTIEMRQGDELDWSVVSYEEAKETIASKYERIDSDGLPNSSEGVGRLILEQSTTTPSRTEITVLQENCVQRVEEALYRAGVPHILRGAGEHGGFAVYVPRLLKSRIWLRRAGFVEDERVRGLLHDPASGQKIELIERLPHR